MHINKKIPYKLGKKLTLMAVGGATLFGACSKENNGTDEILPKHDIELTFTEDNFDHIASDSVRAALARPDVAMVYLLPKNYFSFNRNEINILRTAVLEPLIELDPSRVTGRGDFYFRHGMVSANDSLWYIKNNWTINQKKR